MMIDRKDMLLYVVTDRTWLGDNSLADQVEKAIQSGATLIQIREKDLPFQEFVNLAKEIKLITDRYRIPLVINDDAEVAKAIDADGVHIGQDDGDIQLLREELGKNKIIGLSAHNLEEALDAQAKGADYIGVGAIFPTSSKKDASAVTYDTLKSICQAVTIPVVAIGGISKNNIRELSGSGVDGVAVISAIFAQPDIGKATKELRWLSEQMVNTNN